MSAGTRCIAEASAAVGGSRLLGVVGAGVLQADATTLRNELPGYPERLRAIGAEHQRVSDVLASTDLSWLLVCTPLLVREAVEPTLSRVRLGVNGVR